MVYTFSASRIRWNLFYIMAISVPITALGAAGVAAHWIYVLLSMF